VDDRAGGVNPVLPIHGLGATVAVLPDGPRAGELRLALEAAWARCLPGPPGVRDAGEVRLWLAEAGRSVPGDLDHGKAELAGDDLAALLASATQAVTQALIRAQAGRILLLHAGAVCHPVTGRSLVFVAPGGTGKTTLATTLGPAYGYLTDETVGIDAAGRILPYPKPLSLRTASGRPKDETSPGHLGLLPSHPDPAVARVVVLNRVAAPSAPRLRELALLDAICALVPQSSSLYALPRGLHRCADLIDATGPVLEVTYGEADTLAPLVADLIGVP